MKISVITPTNNPRWLKAAHASLLQQTHQDWEWVLVPNNFDPDTDLREVFDAFAVSLGHSRVRVVHCPPYIRHGSVGAIKAFAFAQGQGEVLLELDHDDLLHPDALAECDRAFKNPAVAFAYSDCADFPETPNAPVTYHSPERQAAWAADGWKFGVTDVPDALELPGNPTKILHPVCFQPTALSVSQIYHAPNHFRAWRAEFYRRIGGHNPELGVCDDLELMQRTYLQGHMRKINRVLYYYRVQGQNTWLQRQHEIAAKSLELRERNLHKLVARECELRGLPCYDLGGRHNSPGAPWVAVDFAPGWAATDDPTRLQVDLRKQWPWTNGSVGAFRAVDLLEHLPDKVHTMSEIYRCLAPGGWLLSFTPDGCGPGAHCDPTHVSYWVERSFEYYTKREIAKYIDNYAERFMAVRLHTLSGKIPYVVADLVSLKDDDGRLPGQRQI